MFAHIWFRVIVIVGSLVASAAAQSWPVGLNSTLQWNVPNVGPANLGGVTFNASGSQLLMVGNATSIAATAYAYNTTRDPGTSRVTGLTPAGGYAPTPAADGGLDLYGGIVFWATYPTYQIGQYNPMTGTTLMTALPTIFQTTGGVVVIPPGYPTAGKLLVSSFSSGDIYAIPLTPAGNGFYNLGTATLWANMPVSGSEGMRFATSGPLAGRLLVANYAYGRLDAVAIDPATGFPVGGPSTPSVTNVIPVLSGLQGVGVDPITGDVFLSSYSGGVLYRVDGFGSFTALSADHPSFSVGGGATVNLYLRSGSSHAGRPYALVASASGTMPGTPVGSIVVPLNVDAITNLVLANINTPLFSNFMATADTKGAAIATFNVPPLAIGAPIGLDFAGVLMNPIDFATNAVHITLIP
jgi:hypothetical protein